MKKSILTLSVILSTSFYALANSITIINTTNCYYDISCQANISVVPPNSNFNESDPNPNKYFGAKIIAHGTPGQVNVGGNPPAPPLTQQAVSSATVGSYPICNGGNPFIVKWEVDASGNITITIS